MKSGYLHQEVLNHYGVTEMSKQINLLHNGQKKRLFYNHRPKKTLHYGTTGTYTMHMLYLN